MGDKSEEVLKLAQEVFDLSKCLYGDKQNKTVIDATFDLARAQMRIESTREMGKNRFKKCLDEWKEFCDNIIYSDECNLYFNMLIWQQSLIINEGLIEIPELDISLLPIITQLCDEQKNNIL
jgi:hypothetical protein